MQDGAASLLSRHLSTPTSNLTAEARGVLQKAFKNLTARDESAWTSGQWMTERVGGSDISGTETLARYHPLEASEKYKQTQIDGSPLGPWVLDGFKWFSSATDSQMTVALAQTPRGLSTFYIPMRRTSSLQLGGSELNGISISRLKNKLGTKPVPTAELELKGARAFLIGEEGNGVREISTILNITRVHNSAIAMGYLGRGIAIAKAFAEVREMVGKGKRVVLKDMKLHAKTLADLVVRYRANLLFTYFTVYCLGVSDQDPSKQTSKPSVAAERLRPRNGNDLQLLLRYAPTLLCVGGIDRLRY
jgi:alkylation response protein AidB-like acyl-CoA dehydrogenase